MTDKISTLISKSTITKARIAHTLKLSTLLFTGAVLLSACGNTNTPIIEEELSTTVNTTPVATFSEFSINKDARYEGQLTAIDADGDKLVFIIVNAPVHGTVVLHDNGCFTYTPNPDYKGSDTFSYKASDDVSSCAVKTVTIDVQEEPIMIPTAPSDLVITALSTTKLKLEWSDKSDNEEGFLIYKDGALVASTQANETSSVICCGLEA